MTKEYDLVGGSSHGKTAAIADSENSFMSTATSDDRESRIGYAETYTRRRFEGEEFGEGYECFGITSDDDTEIQEQARLTLKNRAD